MILILAGSPGIGKTKHANEICKMFGLTKIMDNWDGREPIPEDTLVIGTVRIEGKFTLCAKY